MDSAEQHIKEIVIGEREFDGVRCAEVLLLMETDQITDAQCKILLKEALIHIKTYKPEPCEKCEECDDLTDEVSRLEEIISEIRDCTNQ